MEKTGGVRSTVVGPPSAVPGLAGHVQPAPTRGPCPFCKDREIVRKEQVAFHVGFCRYTPSHSAPKGPGPSSLGRVLRKVFFSLLPSELEGYCFIKGQAPWAQTSSWHRAAYDTCRAVALYSKSASFPAEVLVPRCPDESSALGAPLSFIVFSMIAADRFILSLRGLRAEIYLWFDRIRRPDRVSRP